MAARLTIEQKKRLTREAMSDVDGGRVVDHEAVLVWAESLCSEWPLPTPSPKTR